MWEGIEQAIYPGKQVFESNVTSCLTKPRSYMCTCIHLTFLQTMKSRDVFFVIFMIDFCLNTCSMSQSSGIFAHYHTRSFALVATPTINYLNCVLSLVNV